MLEQFGGIEHNDLNNLLYEKNLNPETVYHIPEQSQYFDLDDIKRHLRKYKNNFSVLSLNIQSINAKFDKINLILCDLLSEDLHFSAICFQESWLKENDDTSLIQIPDYNLVHQGKICCGHGGLLTYIHKTYSWNKRNLYKNSVTWEGQFIEITGGNIDNKITLGNIYKPPKNNNNNINIEIFLNEFSPIISSLGKEKSDTIIVGDFNINLLELNDREKFCEVFDLMCSNSLFPHITFPTRFARKTASLIDQIYCKTRSDSTAINSGIIISNISDHLPCFAFLDILATKPKVPKYIKTRKYSENSIQNFRDELANCHLINKLSKELNTDPNTSYNIIESTVQNLKTKHLPEKLTKYHKHKHKLSQWMTTGILKSIKYRDMLYKKLKQQPDNTSDYISMKVNLKTYNNILNKSIRQAKKTYYHKEFLKYKTDIKKTWTTIKGILNKSNAKSDFPSHFLVNGAKTSDAQLIANKFNEYFVQIGPKLASNIKTDNRSSIDTYLRRQYFTNFAFNLTNPNEILKLINKLPAKTSTGHDGISCKFLKQIADILAPSISLAINHSLYTGIFPTKLKLARLLPLYKKDNNALFENYRPISLLPAISKIYEKVVFKQLYHYFQSNNYFYKSQYGFREEHSTETACLEFIDRTYLELDRGNTPFALFLDLSKAFDTLDHSILLHKLRHYGISNTPLMWFESYLTDRSQYVDLDGTMSQTLNLTTGVPQGSILGPLLFIIYMNDINVVSDIFDFILYADDTSLSSILQSFSANDNVNILSSKINEELEKIYTWLAINKLSLNLKKTKFMIFHYKQKKILPHMVPHIQINNTDIDLVKEFNFLGLTVNEHLDWSSHCQLIANKISRTTGIINKLKHYLPEDVLKIMYNSLILSQLQYCIKAWGFEHHRLLKLQKKAIRLITSSKYNAHTSPLFKKLNLLKLEDIFKVQCLKFYYKLKNETVPQYFRNMFTPNNLVHNYSTRHSQDLHTYGSRTERAKNCLRHYIPKLLQLTPPIITEKIETHSYQGFGNYIKTSLIKDYSTVCTITNCYICKRN